MSDHHSPATIAKYRRLESLSLRIMRGHAVKLRCLGSDLVSWVAGRLPVLRSYAGIPEVYDAD